MKRANEPRLKLVHSVFEVDLKHVGRVSWFESESRALRLCVWVHLRRGGGPGRPIVEAHDHDMTNTGTGKSGCVGKH